jgi:hypothetical protein
MNNKFEIIETPDYILAVLDEEIKESNYKFHLSRKQLFKIHHFSQSNGSKTFIPADEFDLPLNLELLVVDCKDVISYQPKHDNAPELDLPLLPEMVVEDEVEKLVDEKYPYKVGYSVSDENSTIQAIREAFIDGHKTATKIYSEEDLWGAFLRGLGVSKIPDLEDIPIEIIFKNFTQSLKQHKTPKWFVAETIKIPTITPDRDCVYTELLKTITINDKTYLVGKFIYE